MDRELHEQVMVERVELIARLTCDGKCKERDREIALNLIAELAKGKLLDKRYSSTCFDHCLKT